MKKVIMSLVVLCLSMCISLSASAASFNQLTKVFTPEEINRSKMEKVAALQKDAVSAHNFFQENLPITPKGKIIYPKSYAGEYIDDLGNLVMQTTTTDCSEYKYLQEEFSCVKFETVKYSKEYLTKLIDEFISTYNKDIEKFYRAYIDVEQNCVVIEVDEKTLSLRTQTDTDEPIVFKLGSPFELCSTTVYGGDKITNGKIFAIGTNMTAGIGATNFSGGDAIITCGHGMKVNDKIYLGTTRIGTVTYVSYGNNCKGDFSIVTLINGNTSTDIVRISSNNEGFHNIGTYDAVKNQVICKYSKNSGYASFKVTHTDISSSYNGIIIRGQSAADIISGTVKSGDSGAGLFYESSVNSCKSFCGIIAGYDKEAQNITFTPVSSISPYVKKIKSN